MNDYKILEHGTAKVLTVGSREFCERYLKHVLPDGRYRLEGPDLILDCVRTDGIVGPDEEGIQTDNAFLVGVMQGRY